MRRNAILYQILITLYSAYHRPTGRHRGTGRARRHAPGRHHGAMFGVTWMLNTATTTGRIYRGTAAVPA